MPSIFCASLRDAYLQRIADNQDATSEGIPVRVRTSGDSGENDGLREHVRAALVAHLSSLKPQNEGAIHCVLHPGFERTKTGGDSHPSFSRAVKRLILAYREPVPVAGLSASLHELIVGSQPLDAIIEGRSREGFEPIMIGNPRSPV